MGTRTLKIGDYVFWCESYYDGILGKDYGKGLIIETREYDSSQGFECVMYKVYRDKYKDYYWFEQTELELVEDYNEQ